MPDILSPDEINALLAGGGDFNEDEISPEDAEQLEKVSNSFADAAKGVINMLAGKEVNATVGSPEVLEQGDFRKKYSEMPFLFSNTFGGLDDQPMSLVVDTKGALTLADFMMGGTGQNIPEPSDLYLNAAQEGLSQIVGSAFTTLSGLLGGRRLIPENTTSALTEENWSPLTLEPPDMKIWASPIDINITGVSPFRIWACMKLETAIDIAGMMRDIQDGKPIKSSSDEPLGGMGGGSSSGGNKSNDDKGGGNKSSGTKSGGSKPSKKKSSGSTGPLDIISDIPVRVTVELGKARKSVSEILALTSGAVIELDKMAGEPVDILVNGKVIAHGEVVVIDENFGVRLTDIMDADD